MRLIIGALMAFSLVAFGCIATENVASPTAFVSANAATTAPTDLGAATTTPTDAKPDRFAMSEVGKHAVKGDCWLAIQGKVYDVSDYTKHPGGEAILEGCGKDATTLFETRPMGSGTAHSKKAREYMQNFLIGELAK